MARADIMAGRAYVSLYLKNKLTRDLQKAKQSVSKFGSDMMSLGTKMVAMSAAIATPIAFATAKFAEFDDAMRSVKAVTGASEAGFKSMTERAKELGRTTSFTAVEVANLMTELGRAGFNPTEINTMTSAVMNLARATGTDAALSAGIVSATLRQFGLDAGDASRAADVLTLAANSTFNTVEGLGESLKYAGPVAKELGMSLEDTVAILGSLGNVGIQGSAAGSALRRLGIISAASGKELQSLFGVINTDATGKLKPLVQIMDEIGQSLEDVPTTEKIEKMEKAFGLLGITAASVVTGTAAGTNDLAKSLKNAEGSAAAAAKEMDSGLGGAFRIIQSAAEGLQIAIGEALEGSIKKITETITGVIGRVTAWVNKNHELVTTFVAVTAGIATAGVSLIALGISAKIAAVGIGVLASVLGAVKAVVAVLASSPLAVVLGVIAAAALIAAVAGTDFSEAWASAKKTLGNFLSLAKQVGGILMSSLAGGDYDIAFRAALAGMKVALAEAVLIYFDLWGKFWKGVWRMTKSFFNGVLGLTIKTVSAIARAMSDPIGATAELMNAIEDNTKAAFDIKLNFDIEGMRDAAKKELGGLEKELAARKKKRADDKKEKDDNKVFWSDDSGVIKAKNDAQRKKDEKNKPPPETEAELEARIAKLKADELKRVEAAAKVDEAKRKRQEAEDLVVSRVQDFADVAFNDKDVSSEEVALREKRAIAHKLSIGSINEETAKNATLQADLRKDEREHQATLKKFKGASSDDKKPEEPQAKVKAGKSSAATFSARSLMSLGSGKGDSKQVIAITATKKAIQMAAVAQKKQAAAQLAATKKSTLKHP